MNIITEWLAGLPALPDVDEFGRPWACMARYGMTPAQKIFLTELARREKDAPAGEISPAPGRTASPAQAGMVYRNGVVDDTHLYLMEAGRLCRRVLGNIAHAGDLLQICLETGLDAIWILAGTDLSDRATRAFFETAQDWELPNIRTTAPPGSSDKWKDTSQTDGQARATYLMAWKKKEARGRRVPGQDQGRAVYLGYAEHNYSYDFDRITSPVTLLGALAYTEDAIAAPVRFSAQSTGKHLMKTENSNETRAPWIAPVDFSPFPTIARGGRDVPIPTMPATDLVWMRPLTAQEIEQGGYLITGDKNSMYDAACTSAQLGQGAPVYRRGAEINTRKPPIGIYHIRIAGQSIFDGQMLPHPTDGQAESWQWVYTVKLLLDLGYEVEIIEGYIWERAHTTLRPWAERVWNARVALKKGHPDCKMDRYQNEPARLAAYGAMQAIIRGAIGLLAHYPDFADRPGAFDWYRPDWNALIVDHARVKMFYLIWKYAKLGYIPFGVLTDCIYFIGATDNHLQALPGLYDRVNDLGGFKRKFARPVTARQIAALQAHKGYTISEVNNALLKYDKGEIDIAA